MKSFGIICAIFIAAAFVYIFGINNPEINISFGDNYKYTLDLFLYCVFAFLFGAAFGILLMTKAVFDSGDEYKKLKRRYEKTSIGADDSDLKVKTLENKIKTLEEALKKTLEEEKNN